MPKQRRGAANRSPSRPAPKRAGLKPAKATKSKALTLTKGAGVKSKPSPARGVTPPREKRPSRDLAAARATAPQRSPVPQREAPGSKPEAAQAAPRRPAFYEALAIYETGVRALQRHDFAAAADSLRGVIQSYPGERELVERARLYLQVCERETARRPSGPQTPSEAVYAATVALNAGDVDGALAHLAKALERAPESDHAHYIMAVALTDKGDTSLALGHLRQAISLNPDNRSVALQDPDLSGLHGLEAFLQALEPPDATLQRRVRTRR
jgi:tetratricopeptide (TPR) repeat protein